MKLFFLVWCSCFLFNAHAAEHLLDGEYRIFCPGLSVAKPQCIEGGFPSGDSVRLRSPSKSQDQVWKLKAVGNAVYHISVDCSLTPSMQCLEGSGDSVRVNPPSESQGQVWKLKAVGNDAYHIFPGGLTPSAQCLEGCGDSVVRLRPQSESQGQVWKLANYLGERIQIEKQFWKSISTRKYAEALSTPGITADLKEVPKTKALLKVEEYAWKSVLENDRTAMSEFYKDQAQEIIDSFPTGDITRELQVRFHTTRNAIESVEKYAGDCTNRQHLTAATDFINSFQAGGIRTSLKRKFNEALLENRPQQILSFARLISILPITSAEFRTKAEKLEEFISLFPDDVSGLNAMFDRELEIARGHADIYRRFLMGKLIYRPNPGSDEGKIELPIRDLANPLEGTFELSRCGDTGQYISISTGYRKGLKAENARKTEIWITPRFLVERDLASTARNLQPIMGNWDATTAPVGLFWTNGSWSDEYFDYLTTNSWDALGSENLSKKGNEKSSRWMLPAEMAHAGQSWRICNDHASFFMFHF